MKTGTKVIGRLAATGALLLLSSAAGAAGVVGPDSFGYSARDNVAYGFTDISGTGAALMRGTDDDRALVNLGFTFNFYGKSYTQACISSNGLISFGATQAKDCNMDFVNQDLTSTAPGGNPPAIAPFWTDLSFLPQGAGAVHYQTLGATAGSRRFVAQWTNAFPLNTRESVTFQVILFEGDGRILVQYRDVQAGGGTRASLGGTATVGIRDANGNTNGRVVQWSCNAPALKSQMAILFAPGAAYLRGSGGTANPPTLFLSITPPAAATEKYSDSSGIKFSGGNAWAAIGTWTAEPTLAVGQIATLKPLQVWIGLKNSDDQGTRFDLRAEILKNGAQVHWGETRCIEGVTRNASLAKAVSVAFTPIPPVLFGPSDVLSLKILTRIGTDVAGGFCGGHSNAVGLRLYFDSTGRSSKLEF